MNVPRGPQGTQPQPPGEKARDRQEKEREGENHETRPRAYDLQLNGGIPEEVPAATFDAMKVPTCQSLRAPSGLKIYTAAGPDQLWGWCPLVLGSVARQFWGWSPLRGVPACETTSWSQHYRNAAGTDTSTARLALPGTLPSPVRDAGSHGLEMPPRHHDPSRAVVALQPRTTVGLSSTVRTLDPPARELLSQSCSPSQGSLKDTLRPEAPESSR